jgi:RimJ/RimL family protein N-acetyltransferase
MLSGERVRLRAVEEADLPFFVEWLNDLEVSQWLSRAVPLSMAEEEDWFRGLRALRPEERPLAIEARTADGWLLIGNSGLGHFEHTCPQAELGIFIGRKDHQNQGYGREVLRLLLDYGFGSLNLERIYLRVLAENQRAIHVYEKVGFVHEARLRHAVVRDGAYGDILVMSVLRSEWEQGSRETPGREQGAAG